MTVAKRSKTLLSTFLRLTWCGFGASAGIALALHLTSLPASPFLFASLGGSAVFLFGLTSADAAQPRALFGGHLGAAIIGIAFYQIWGDALWVYALAQATVLVYMLVTKTTHPPAGANALIMIHGHAAWTELWQPIFIGVMSLALVTVAWSRLYPGLMHYPRSWFAPSPNSTGLGGWAD